MKELRTEVLVIGSGITGLTFALRAAEYADVLVVTKKDRAEASTNYAQGGIAAVFDPGDSVDLHVRDTLLAGAGLCDREAVEELAREGPRRVRKLIEWGVDFSRKDGELALGREGGHSRRRILHAADLTGQEIERSLLSAVAEDSRIRVLEDHFVWSLRTSTGTGSEGRRRCCGALVLDVDGEGWVRVTARAVLLAAGGCGRLYRHTTNPSIATGDGVAMAYGAGAAVADMEFMQFHPTALHPAGSHAFLVSEAVRGEGAVLRNGEGDPFVREHHRAGSLAPRDVVARAIHAEMKESGADHVWLDLSTLESGDVEGRFPGLVARCRERGIHLPEDPIPVVPAAHYQCGGVLTDRDGRTTLPGLYAAGETACTGVHGANRLASNSLLEAVVYAARASRRVAEEIADVPEASGGEVPPPGRRDGADPAEEGRRLRDLMWERVGIVRSEDGLIAAREELDRLEARPVARGRHGPEAMQSREVEFMRTAASLVVRSALRRRESRGLHYTESHPHRDNEAFLRDTVLVP